MKYIKPEIELVELNAEEPLMAVATSEIVPIGFSNEENGDAWDD